MYKTSCSYFAKTVRYYKRIVFSACDIPFIAKIGESASFPHRAIGIVIHSGAKTGVNYKIKSNITIGATRGKETFVIGDSCFLGAGFSIIGDTYAGNNCITDADVVVVKDAGKNY